MKIAAKLVIYTDLDGTLLDEASYSFEAAREALAMIDDLEIPLVLCTSKTMAELGTLRRELQNRHPFIVENGAGVCIPPDYFGVVDADLQRRDGYLLKSFGTELAELNPELKLIKKDLGVRYRGFSEMSAEEIIRHTGLSKNQAFQAKVRSYSEPVLWDDSDGAWQLFSAALTDAGIRYQRGGRFIHLSRGGDKGQAMAWLTGQYLENGSSPIITVALGDSENDIPMLKIADFPVVVRSARNPLGSVPGRADAMVTREPGPAGWSQAVITIIEMNARKRAD